MKQRIRLLVYLFLFTLTGASSIFSAAVIESPAEAATPVKQEILGDSGGAGDQGGAATPEKQDTSIESDDSGSVDDQGEAATPATPDASSQDAVVIVNPDESIAVGTPAESEKAKPVPVSKEEQMTLMRKRVMEIWYEKQEKTLEMSKLEHLSDEQRARYKSESELYGDKLAQIMGSNPSEELIAEAEAAIKERAVSQIQRRFRKKQIRKKREAEQKAAPAVWHDPLSALEARMTGTDSFRQQTTMYQETEREVFDAIRQTTMYQTLLKDIFCYALNDTEKSIEMEDGGKYTQKECAEKLVLQAYEYYKKQRYHYYTERQRRAESAGTSQDESAKEQWKKIARRKAREDLEAKFLTIREAYLSIRSKLLIVMLSDADFSFPDSSGNTDKMSEADFIDTMIGLVYQVMKVLMPHVIADRKETSTAMLNKQINEQIYAIMRSHNLPAGGVDTLVISKKKKSGWSFFSRKKKTADEPEAAFGVEVNPELFSFEAKCTVIQLPLYDVSDDHNLFAGVAAKKKSFDAGDGKRIFRQFIEVVGVCNLYRRGIPIVKENALKRVRDFKSELDREFLSLFEEIHIANNEDYARLYKGLLENCVVWGRQYQSRNALIPLETICKKEKYEIVQREDIYRSFYLLFLLHMRKFCDMSARYLDDKQGVEGMLTVKALSSKEQTKLMSKDALSRAQRMSGELGQAKEALTDMAQEFIDDSRVMANKLAVRQKEFNQAIHDGNMDKIREHVAFVKAQTDEMIVRARKAVTKTSELMLTASKEVEKLSVVLAQNAKRFNAGSGALVQAWEMAEERITETVNNAYKMFDSQSDKFIARQGVKWGARAARLVNWATKTKVSEERAAEIAREKAERAERRLQQQGALADKFARISSGEVLDADINPNGLLEDQRSDYAARQASASRPTVKKEKALVHRVDIKTKIKTDEF